MSWLRRSLILVPALLLTACSHLSYYAQAVGGHLRIMHAARPIPSFLQDPAVAPGLKARLRQVDEIRIFAHQKLALPDNGSYENYADLGRPYVVWNVFAAKEFSSDLEAWCLLFVGCVNYRGYYSREAAERFAAQLREQGLETHVANIPAYSTLGYFPDPVLNTFLGFGPQEVARLIFHELAHQVVFIPGDSTFNESFATTVEIEGMRHWLAERGTEEDLRQFAAKQQRKLQFLGLVADYRARLRQLYGENLPAEEKRSAKAALIAELKRSYGELRAQWGVPGSYDRFFNQEINNATLGSVGLYSTLVPAFQALLAQSGHDLHEFYRRVRAIARQDKSARQETLNALLAEHGAEAPAASESHKSKKPHEAAS